MNYDALFKILGLIIVIAPAFMMLLLGLPTLVGRPLKERTIGRCVQVCVVTGLLAALSMLGLMLYQGTRHVPLVLGSWVEVHEFHFAVKFLFDRLSIPFVILSFALCGTIGAFANRYMHREQGFNRFFVLFAFFVCGMIITSLAGNIETLFAGWELVGLSSAMLVAFFHERQAPVRNGLRVWTVYRISDAALLIASVILHHMHGHGDFDAFLSVQPWPEGETALTAGQALGVGALLVLAAAGKSALVPFSGWLPRAMEGPTPSSAVFYGALSVHLGAFLLLRTSLLLNQSFALSAMVVTLGLLTAVYAAFAERVQTDIKSALSFASLTQVGLIVAEIGLGLRYLALAHILGHACLRTLQFLRAPTLLHDYRVLENAIGGSLAANGSRQHRLPARMQQWLYRFALERGYLDNALDNWIGRPFVALFRGCDRLERRWTDFLAGGESRETEPVVVPSKLDELI